MRPRTGETRREKMLSVVESSAILGVSAYGARVEVNVANTQIPMFTIVGLPDAAVQESKERVRAAIKTAGTVDGARWHRRLYLIWRRV